MMETAKQHRKMNKTRKRANKKAKRKLKRKATTLKILVVIGFDYLLVSRCHLDTLGSRLWALDIGHGHKSTTHKSKRKHWHCKWSMIHCYSAKSKIRIRPGVVWCGVVCYGVECFGKCCVNAQRECVLLSLAVFTWIWRSNDKQNYDKITHTRTTSGWIFLYLTNVNPAGRRGKRGEK